MNVNLDREVTIHRIAVPGDEGYIAPDADFGTAKVVWVPLAPMPGSPPIGYRFPARIQDVRYGRNEDVQAGLVVSARRAVCNIRWRGDVDNSMQVTVHGNGDVVYRIVSPVIEVFGKMRELEFIIERVSS